MGEKTLSASLLCLSLCTWQLILLAEGIARLTLKFCPQLNITLQCDYVFPFLKKRRSSFFLSFILFLCMIVEDQLALELSHDCCVLQTLWWILYSPAVLTCRTFAGSGGDTIFIFPVRKLYIYIDFIISGENTVQAVFTFLALPKADRDSFYFIWLR